MGIADDARLADATDARPAMAGSTASRLSDVGWGAQAALLVLAWTVVGTLAFSRQYFDNPRWIDSNGLLPAYAEWLTCYLPWGLLSLVVLAAERRFPIGRGRWGRNVLVLALLGVPMAYAAWLLTAAFGAAFAALGGLTSHVQLRLIIPPRELLGHGLMYLAAAGGAAILRTMGEARENERRAARLMLEKARLETSLREAELDALRMRLQPHFLFNSLQNISVLTQHDPVTASRMLTRLGDLLRASLARDREAETTLATEIALTQAYLAVEEMRFGDRLASTVDVAPGTEQALVPTFLLQPLVENALRHGLQHRLAAAGPGHRGLLTIQSARDGASLTLTVRDNGVGVPEGLSADAFGIGLGATCERLSRLYGDRHGFTMRGLPEGGTEVRITLPFRPAAPEVREHVQAAGADRRR
jgi:two-component system LytT family sensor kinase